MSLCSVGVTLQLLQGPSKLLVASGFGVGVDLLLKAAQPAQCFLYRQPYDDDVFSGAAGDSAAAEVVRTPPSILGVLPETTKERRPIGSIAVARICSVRNIVLTLGRNEALSCLLVCNRWFQEQFEEEERAELEGREPRLVPFPMPLLQLAAYKGLFNSCVEWVVQVVRAGLDVLAAQRLRPDLSASLIKDLRSSAMRKAGRYVWWYRGLRVARTSLFSEATLYAADALVSMGTECYAAATWYAGSAAKRLRRLALRCALQAARAAVVLAAVSVGNGVGSMSPFRRGLAMFFCAQAASFGTNYYMAALMERLTADGAPEPGAHKQGVRPGSGSQGAGVGGGGGGRIEDAGAGGGSGAHGPPALLVNVNGHFMLVPPGVAPQAAQAVAAVPAANAPAAAAAAQHVVEQAAQAQAEEDGHVEEQAQAVQEVQAAPVAQAAQAAQPNAAAAAAAARAGLADAAVQAAGPEAAEPLPPEPQQRRPVVGGPRLPERPQRRLAGGAAAPQPQAPQTPQFKDQRAPTPNQDSEEAEATAAAGAVAGVVAGAVAGVPSGSAAGAAAGEAPAPAATGGRAAGVSVSKPPMPPRPGTS